MVHPEGITEAVNWKREHIQWLEGLVFQTTIGTESLRIMIRELTGLVGLKKELERSILNVTLKKRNKK